MRNTLNRERNITPEKAMEILLKNGISIDKKDAEEMLELMYFIAKLIVDQNFKK
ncbi:hypothetical protein [Pedobacter sp. SL55]|uniref:hypothetical protein n=1 Tax=Pedobacter sp. SL55 TaxID=2995161 RepID=UPI00226EA264|nr:hypothetical protein [Pedobacter sp. SL55]WAC40382.1 hypothetical protein OVA16_17695 [Pedobacter sp. SL55]